MIGFFLINKQGQLAFTQLGQHKQIAGFRYHEGAAMCMVELETGEEDAFNEQTPPAVVTAMKANTQILVAHLDKQGETLAEYFVPMRVVP